MNFERGPIQNANKVKTIEKLPSGSLKVTQHSGKGEQMFTSHGDQARIERAGIYGRLVGRFGFERVLRHARAIASAITTRQAEEVSRG